MRLPIKDLTLFPAAELVGSWFDFKNVKQISCCGVVFKQLISVPGAIYAPLGLDRARASSEDNHWKDVCYKCSGNLTSYDQKYFWLALHSAKLHRLWFFVGWDPTPFLPSSFWSRWIVSTKSTSWDKKTPKEVDCKPVQTGFIPV